MSAVIGHDAQVAAFREALGQGRVHHAWLLAGPEGIGKARFAEAAALYFLADGAGEAAAGQGLDLPPDCPTLAYARAGSHPDYQRLARLPKEKTGELARNIPIDQVRALQRLFATVPTFSRRRAVVIDAIDDMERAAANALLKNLEEPPADTLFLLVSHAPGRLLPTIRSRCRLLRFAALDDRAMEQVLATALPDMAPAERTMLAGLGDGAPGQALRFADLDVAGLDAAMERLVHEGDATNAGRVALARALSGKAAQARYEIFLERAPSRIAAHARTLTGAPLADAVALWEQARSLATGAVRLSLDPQTTVFEIAGMLAALAPGASSAKA